MEQAEHAGGRQGQEDEEERVIKLKSKTHELLEELRSEKRDHRMRGYSEVVGRQTSVQSPDPFSLEGDLEAVPKSLVGQGTIRECFLLL